MVHNDWKNQCPPANPPVSQADRSRNKGSGKLRRCSGQCQKAHLLRGRTSGRIRLPAMPAFPQDSFDHLVGEQILAAFEQTWDGLGRPGTWWTGAQRMAIAEASRSAMDDGPRPIGLAIPALVDLDHVDGSGISDLALEVVRRVTSESGRITAAWAAEAIGLMGPGRYVELVAMVVLTVPIDIFCGLLGRPRQSLPEVVAGEPVGGVPDGVAAGEAYVPWLVDGWRGPNVARALSYVPADNDRRLAMVSSMYDGSEFFEMVWSHRSLSRPQIELLAARTSALNECFY
jgi:hypothetical protein